MRISLFIFVVTLSGCATPRTTEKSVEEKAYERGFGQAVKEQYWIIQNQQRDASKMKPKDQQP